MIFDMNGVIVDDERIHQKSWREMCKKYGFMVTEEEFKHKVFGRTEKDTLNYLLKRELNDIEVSKYSKERVKIAIDIYKDKITPTKGLLKILNLLNELEIPLAIATSARIPYTNFVLDTLKIRKYFSAIITAEDIVKGKPHPEIYLQAANKLAIEPSKCVAIEDTLSGITSAKSAKMFTIGITTTHTEKELESADLIVSSFEELNNFIKNFK